MSHVDWSEFADFYAEINGGALPFAWQQRLMDGLATTGAWPDVVSAPTGSGKSVPVIAHIFANAAAASTGMRIPRRLVTVVNRRALVDVQHEQAANIQRRLANADDDPSSLLGRVRAALESLTPRPDKPSGGLTVVQMRGQIARDAQWLDDPAACAVIAATPDMWGSRLMFGGYGTPRFARPREAGLFAYDCVAALDETHLNRQLALTALRVRDLAGRHADKLGVPALQVVLLSATQEEGAAAALPNRVERPATDLKVEESDLQADAALRDRLQRPKPVTYVPSGDWAGTGAAHKRYVKELVARVLALKARVRPENGAASTVGCIVNRVETAAEVEAALAAAGLETAVWVGRMRPYDLAQARVGRSDLFTVAGDDSVDVLVATSTVEVGVDIDLAGLVTELCSGTALTQRFGRVNRLGRRDSAPITVIGPPVDDQIKHDVAPYVAPDLAEAREWVVRRADAPAGVAPWALLADPAPSSTLPRVVLERLEPGIVEMLAATSEHMFTELTLNRWLHDDFDEERDPVLLVPRRFHGTTAEGEPAAPLETPDVVTLLSQTPVLEAEAYPATYKQGVYFVERILDGEIGDDPRVIDVTDPGVPVLVHDSASVRPGGVYVVAQDVHLSRRGVVTQSVGREVSTPVFWGPTPRGDSQHFDEWTGSKAAETGVSEWVDLSDEGLVFLPGDTDDDGIAWCDELAVPEDEVVLRLREIRARGMEAVLPPGSMLNEGDEATRRREGLPWVVLLPKRDFERDEEARQEWTSAAWVALDHHQGAVGERAAALAASLGLPDDVAARMRDAGLHHDDGKRASTFQRLMRDGMSTTTRAEVGAELLAKSGTPRAVQLHTRGVNVVPGWRHEQFSVVWASARESVTDPLTLRLIGASHGRGRSGFTHLTLTLLKGAPEVSRDDVIAGVTTDLFDHGEWDRLIGDTHEAWGVWGCAYLEAVLRAADCQVSQEGS